MTEEQIAAVMRLTETLEAQRQDQLRLHSEHWARRDADDERDRLQRLENLRDAFAREALVGLLRAADRETLANLDVEDIAHDSYAIADAMMTERARR